MSRCWLESGSVGTEDASMALLPLTVASREALAFGAARGGVVALLVAIVGRTLATQAMAAGVLRNLAAFWATGPGPSSVVS